MRTATSLTPLFVLTLAALTPSLGCPAPTGSDPAPAQKPAPDPAPEAAGAGSSSPAPVVEAPSDADAVGAAAQRHTESLEADPAQSKVGFAVARATTGHIGRFERFTAHLELVDEQPTSLEITVQTGSVVADRAGLTSHLKSGDFFDASKFPTAVFTTERITARPEVAPNTFELAGTMRLHGVGRKLAFEATIDVEPDRVVGRAPLDISAKAFGIQYEGMEAELAEDSVQLEVELVFPRPKV